MIIVKRAGGTYKWTKVGNRAGWVWFVCAVVWMGNGGHGGTAHTNQTQPARFPTFVHFVSPSCPFNYYHLLISLH